MKNSHVLVTRPETQVDHLLALLKKNGVAATHFPLLKIETLDNSIIEQQLRTLNDVDAIICISGHAAQFGLTKLKALSVTPAPHLQWFAMGGSTADVLRAHGVFAVAPAQAGTSETLLALSWFAEVSHKRVMIWKGEGGREHLTQTLRSNGALVNEVELYRRVLPVYAPYALDQVLIEQTIDIIMLTSGQALTNLWQLAVDKTRVNNISVLVPSERVAEQARALGFTQVFCANGADDQSMIECLQQVQTQTERSA